MFDIYKQMNEIDDNASLVTEKVVRTRKLSESVKYGRGKLANKANEDSAEASAKGDNSYSESITGNLHEDLLAMSDGKPVKINLSGDALSVYNELIKHKPIDNDVFITNPKNSTISLMSLYRTKDLIPGEPNADRFEAACDKLKKSIKIPAGAKIVVFAKFGISVETIAVRVENISLENKLDEK